MKIEPGALPRHEAHDFFASLIVPRPIAFVSTVNEKGQYNAAPFSAFNRLANNPPVVAIGIARRKGQKKDTVRNIEAIGDFVINLVDENLAAAMSKTSAEFPPEVDEIKEAGLTPLKSDKVKSPRIAEAPISIECKLLQTIELGNSPNRGTIILGEVVMIHIKDEVMTGGKIDPLKAKIVGRLGESNIYCRTTDIFKLDRPRD